MPFTWHVKNLPSLGFLVGSMHVFTVACVVFPQGNVCACTVACFVFPQGGHVPALHTLFHTFSFGSFSTIMMWLNSTNVYFQVEQLRTPWSRAAVYANSSGSARKAGKQHSQEVWELCQAARRLLLELVESELEEMLWRGGWWEAGLCLPP